MKFLAVLTLLRDIIFGVRDIIKRVKRAVRDSVVNKAIIKAEKEGDQRGVEEALSGVSGRPTKHKYNGLHTRKPKKRN